MEELYLTYSLMYITQHCRLYRINENMYNRKKKISDYN